MTIKNAGEIAIERVDETLQPLWRCATPMLRVGDRGQPEVYGSAVLLKVGGECFLATARHVVEENKKSSLYVDGPAKPVRLERDLFCTEPGSNLDVGILRLDRDLEGAFAKYVFLDESHIIAADRYSSSNYATLIGYPGTRSLEKRHRNVVCAQAYSMGVPVSSMEGAFIRCPFRIKRNRNTKSRMIVRAPDPHGMSGGAMFCTKVGLDAVVGDPSPKLAGISTEWHEEKNEFVGTKIAVVLAIIRATYGTAVPELLAPAAIVVDAAKANTEIGAETA